MLKPSCAGHMGVKDWFGANAAEAEAPIKAAAPASAPAVAATKTAPAATKTAATSTELAAGGGPCQVWVNSSSKVYHCSGAKDYGKTKQGEYMTEAAAKGWGQSRR